MKRKASRHTYIGGAERSTLAYKYGGILLKSRVVPFSSYEKPKGGIDKTSDEHVVLVHPQTVYAIPFSDRRDPETLEKA